MTGKATRQGQNFVLTPEAEIGVERIKRLLQTDDLNRVVSESVRLAEHLTEPGTQIFIRRSDGSVREIVPIVPNARLNR